MVDDSIEAIRAARVELDAVIAEIRAVDGFQDFLAPSSFDDVAAAANDHPLVYLAAAELGGLALIVRGPDVTHVELATLTAQAVRTRVEEHLGAYGEFRVDPDHQRGNWDAALDTVTSWLWTDAMGPVLAELTDVDHAVLIAGGLLGLLPLHAAWTPAPSPTDPHARRYALDQIALSYCPNARALAVARNIAQQTPPSRLLSVVDPISDAAPLPYATPEAAGFAAACGIAHRELRGTDATPLAFRNEAVNADVLHLVCHGQADLTEPLRSALMLTARPVDLEQLMAMRLQVRLAVLSACETALPGTELPDEVIGLPTGLLQAGVAGVIASLWAVPDRATAMLMTEFARRWRADSGDPAEALRRAQQWVRDTTNREKINHWRAARSHAPTLPDAVIDAFVDPLASAEPDARDHAGAGAWAAFTHLGA